MTIRTLIQDAAVISVVTPKTVEANETEDGLPINSLLVTVSVPGGAVGVRVRSRKLLQV